MTLMVKMAKMMMQELCKLMTFHRGQGIGDVKANVRELADSAKPPMQTVQT